MFYFAFTYEFHSDLVKGINSNAVVGLTAGNGNEAIACMAQGIGVCVTPTHKSELLDHIASKIFSGFRKPDSPWHDPEIAASLHGVPAVGDNNDVGAVTGA